jgi:DNA-binding transcriptional MocR family regulator
MHDPVPGFAMMPRWLQRSAEVTPAAKLVYLALSSRADRYGASWPSHRLLADECSVSIRTVQRALEELRALGVVAWEARARAEDGGRTSNRYRLVTPVESPVDK